MADAVGEPRNYGLSEQELAALIADKLEAEVRMAMQRLCSCHFFALVQAKRCMLTFVFD